MIELSRRPSPRTLVLTAVAAVVLAAAGAGLWLWSSARESAALGTYAAAMLHAQAAAGPQATPETRAQAIAELEAALRRYPSASAAPQAALEVGNLRYAERRWDTARAAYQVALGSGATPTVATLARAGIAATWEAERNFPKAIEAYRDAARGLRPSDFLYEEMQAGLARNQELAGQKADAISTYKKILGERPASPRADEIRARLAALGAAL